MKEETVFVVDDDPGMRKSLAFLVESLGLRVETFASADEFLQAYDPRRLGCLVLDLRMPGMSGAELQDHLATLGVSIPIIMVSAYGDVPTVARAMRHGAVHFLSKPFSDQEFLDCVNEAIDRARRIRRQQSERERLESRVRRLTKRERQVLKGVVDGKQNKVIAAELGLSPKTIESHRSRVMAKMGASSVAELVRLALAYERLA
ncbi:MAG: DNA-binding response regulator, partial [Deltaproteobacteria bacterium]